MNVRIAAGVSSADLARMLCSVFEAELADHIPVVKTSIAGTRLVGRLTVGTCACFVQWSAKHGTMPRWALVGISYASSNCVLCTHAGNKNGLLVPNTTTDQGV